MRKASSIWIWEAKRRNLQGFCDGIGTNKWKERDNYRFPRDDCCAHKLGFLKYLIYSWKFSDIVYALRILYVLLRVYLLKFRTWKLIINWLAFACEDIIVYFFLVCRLLFFRVCISFQYLHFKMWFWNAQVYGIRTSISYNMLNFEICACSLVFYKSVSSKEFLVCILNLINLNKWCDRTIYKITIFIINITIFMKIRLLKCTYRIINDKSSRYVHNMPPQLHVL